MEHLTALFWRLIDLLLQKPKPVPLETKLLALALERLPLKKPQSFF